MRNTATTSAVAAVGDRANWVRAFQRIQLSATGSRKGRGARSLAVVVALLVALACGTIVGLGGLLTYEVAKKIVLRRDG